MEKEENWEETAEEASRGKEDKWDKTNETRDKIKSSILCGKKHRCF